MAAYVAISQEILFSVLFFGFAVLFLMTGIGLLKRQKWSRASAGIIFGLSFFGGLSSLSSSFHLSNQDNLSTGAVLGTIVGRLVALILSGIIFYGMLNNKSVDNYFKRG